MTSTNIDHKGAFVEKCLELIDKIKMNISDQEYMELMELAKYVHNGDKIIEISCDDVLSWKTVQDNNIVFITKYEHFPFESLEDMQNVELFDLHETIVTDDGTRHVQVGASELILADKFTINGITYKIVM